MYACKNPSKISKYRLKTAGIPTGITNFISSIMMNAATMLPNKRRHSESGRMPISSTFIGAIIGVGLPRCLKKPKKPCFLMVAPSMRHILIKASAMVKLKSLVGGFMKSPLYYQNKKMKKKTMSNAPKITNRFLWTGTTVKRILKNEFYKGTLVCHKTHTNKIYQIREVLPVEENFVHENFVPAIISKEKWEQVQFLLQSKTRKNIRASSSKPCHRYAGLLKCAECGCSFVCKTRKNSDSPNRFEYNCNGYHRYGTEHCTAHRIDEDMLDKLIYSELLSIGICRIFH